MSHFDHTVLCKIYFGTQFFKVVFSCSFQGFLKLFQSSFLDIVYFSFIIGPVLVPFYAIQDNGARFGKSLKVSDCQ